MRIYLNCRQQDIDKENLRIKNYELWMLMGYVEQIDIVQWAVLIFGVTEVLLARANNIWLYPAGITSTVLAIYSLLTTGLYAESILYLYYIVMSLYGWWNWAVKKDAPRIVITFANRREWIISLVIIFGGWGLLYIVLINFTPSTVPLWDSWISSTAWAGTWLLARRKVENWILLNVSNVFAVPLLIQKGLPLLALLTFILFVIACWGYVGWKKTAKLTMAKR